MKRVLKRTAIIFAFLSIAALACLLAFARTLVTSRAYVVTATCDGKPVRAKLMRPAFKSGIFYLQLLQESPQRYDWFLIAFPQQLVAVPVVSARSGWLGIPYVHADQMGGVSLTSGKIEDSWNVVFAPEKVEFSNASLSVALERRD